MRLTPAMMAAHAVGNTSSGHREPSCQWEEMVIVAYVARAAFQVETRGDAA